MPNYAHPGLYFIEQSGQAPVKGNSTTVASFIGTASKGTVGKAVLISSWTQFVSLYGGFYGNGYLSYAVRGFFENGGNQCYIVRVVKYTTGTKTSVIATKNFQGIVAQVETATIAGTVTTAGNATITVTSAGMTGSPKAVTVAVALNDTASTVAGKVRTALSADVDVSGKFTVSGTSADVVLTLKVPSQTNDATLNIASTNGTCAGLTPAPTSANTVSGGLTNSIQVDAINDGAWGNTIGIEIISASAPQFTFTARYNGVVMETYTNVTLANVNQATMNSNYIRVTSIHASIVPMVASPVALAGGDDGLTSIADSDYVGDSSVKNGLYALDAFNPDLVAIPGMTTATIVTGINTYVTGRGDCFAVIDTPLGSLPTASGTGSLLTYINTTVNLTSEFCGVFYPWLNVSDPLGGGKKPYKLVPPSGHICGVIANVDGTRGVWQAPAGIDTKMLGVVNLEYSVSDIEQDVINPESINAIRNINGVGMVVWGSRTTDINGDYAYIPVKRTMIYLKKALRSSLNWTVFKPNNPKLWGDITDNVSAFLRKLRSNGALAGDSDAESFFVKCDGDNNTQDTIDLGFTYVDIGVAIVKPTEFVVFTLALKK